MKEPKDRKKLFLNDQTRVATEAAAKRRIAAAFASRQELRLKTTRVYLNTAFGFFIGEKHLNRVRCYGDDSLLKHAVIFLPWRPSLLAGPRLLKLQEVPEGSQENVLDFQHETVKPQRACKQIYFRVYSGYVTISQSAAASYSQGSTKLDQNRLKKSGLKKIKNK